MTDAQLISMLRTDYPGIVILRDFAAQDEYDDAVEAFACGGSRQELITRLMAIGMTADEIRWHSEYPGRRTATLAGE